MFSYTVNLSSWQMPAPMDTPDQTPKKTRTSRRPSIPFREAFRAKYPEWEFIVDQLKAAIGKEPKWEHLTRSNLVRFIDHLNASFAPNTVNQYATRLKTVLNIYAEETKLPVSYPKILSPKKIPSTAIYLSEPELAALEAYAPKNEKELLVRNLFICSAYTGARWIDIMSLNKSNIRDNELIFIAHKTHKEARLPLKPIVAEYIAGMPKATVDKMTYNRTIQRICKAIGLTEPVKILKAGKEIETPKYQAVSSHTARRSFATNLYLRGVDIYTISRLLQHSEIALTTKYICANIRPLDQKAKDYFA